MAKTFIPKVLKHYKKAGILTYFT